MTPSLDTAARDFARAAYLLGVPGALEELAGAPPVVTAADDAHDAGTSIGAARLAAVGAIVAHAARLRLVETVMHDAKPVLVLAWAGFDLGRQAAQGEPGAGQEQGGAAA